jgi:hypothetical protein
MPTILQQLASVAADAVTKYGYADLRAKKAVKDWQQSHGGLKIDGIYGPGSASVLATDLTQPQVAPVAYFDGLSTEKGGDRADPIKRPTRNVAIATMAKAIRQAGTEIGHPIPDTLLQLMLGQMLGAEGAMPGLPGTMGGTNNPGATQVPGGSLGAAYAAAHRLLEGWGALAHFDSNPPLPGTNAPRPYLGWYFIAPNALEAARKLLTGYQAIKVALAQNPSTPEDYARIMYTNKYFTGTGTDSEKMIAAYAKNIRSKIPSMEVINGPSNDPSVISIDTTQFAPLEKRKITKDLFDMAKNGKDGSAWSFLLPDSWEELVKNNGVVWFGPPPPVVDAILSFEDKMGFFGRIAFVAACAIGGVVLFEATKQKTPVY